MADAARWMASAALVLSVAAAASSCSGGTSAPSEPQPITVDGDTSEYTEKSILLSDGRTVTCIQWNAGSGTAKNARGSIDCDWANAEGTE